MSTLPPSGRDSDPIDRPIRDTDPVTADEIAANPRAGLDNDLDRDGIADRDRVVVRETPARDERVVVDNDRTVVDNDRRVRDYDYVDDDNKGPVQEQVVRSAAARWMLALLRIILGFTFLWAFLDKMFGLGFRTTKERSWLEGGSPTTGFLKGANPDGPLASVFHGMAGQAWADWLFMLGLLGIGVALITGAGVKLAGWLGALLVFLMYLAAWPVGHSVSWAAGAEGREPGTNPFLDEHITEMFALLTLAFTYAGDTLGVGKWWRKIVGDSFLR